MGSTSNLMATSYAIQSASSLAGGIAQAGAIGAQGEYQQRISAINAAQANAQALDAEKRGNTASLRYQSKVSQMQGAQRAAAAASGVDVGSGSAHEIQEETSAMGALDALTIRNNAWREAMGYKQQATSIAGQGAFAGIAARGQATNTLLTGGMQSLGYGMRGMGVWARGRGGGTGEIGEKFPATEEWP